MSEISEKFREMSAAADVERDKNLIAPDNVDEYVDIDYLGTDDRFNFLDVYRPKGERSVLPVVINVHGGGYVYGEKEVYRHYGMFWATQGFVFVNGNYHLAPEHKFPTQLEEINAIVKWTIENATEYGIDTENIFMVGDSAGAQMLSQYACICSNKEYAGLFSFKLQEGFIPKAIALNCGMYDLKMGDPEDEMYEMNSALFRDYLGNAPEEMGIVMDVCRHISSSFPPAYVMTSYYDFLKDKAKPFYDLLVKVKVPSVYKCYGSAKQQYMGHVCHVNMGLKEAAEICKDEIEFFGRYI